MGDLMNKIMALDIGTKRIGVALSDYLHITCSGHSCIQRNPQTEAVSKIKEIAKENNVNKIVIGIPVNMDGTKGFQAKDCIEFSQPLFPSSHDKMSSSFMVQGRCFSWGSFISHF